MNLTELALELNKEMDRLKIQYQNLIQETTSLLATQKSLTYQIEQKELIHEELSQKLPLLREEMITLQKTIETETQKNKTQSEQAKKDLEKELEAERKEYNESMAILEADINARLTEAYKNKGSIDEKIVELQEREENLILKEQDIESKQIALNTMRDESLKQEQERNSIYEKYKEELDIRNKELERKEQDISRRIADLAKSERDSADRENTTRATLQNVTEKSERLQSMIDSHERRLKSFLEKEKDLEIRAIKLSDRESVAATHH